MKKKWGKLLAATLSTAMILSMAACGSNGGAKQQASSAKQQASSANKSSVASKTDNKEQKEAETPQ